MEVTLQEMRKKARKDEEEKLAEMAQINDRYKDLRRRIDAAVCTRRRVQTRWMHPYCNKCNNEQVLRSLSSVAILSFRMLFIDCPR